MVDEVFELADKVAERKPEEAEKAYRLADHYAKKLADYYNKDNEITCRCPSVMIAGPANFPVRKKEKQNQTWGRNHENYQKCEQLKEKIKNLLTKKEIIKSDDKNAIEKLEKKIANMEELQEKMKAVNAFYRKNKTLDGCDILTPETIEKLKYEMKNSWRQQPKPFETYELSNNRQNIRAAKARLERLKNIKENTPEEETEIQIHNQDTDTKDICRVVENTELMRLQLLFDGKPDEEVRSVLKSNGFRWSPKNSAWQRQLTDNAKYALKRVIREIEDLQTQQEA